MVAPAYHEDSYLDRVLSANLDSTFAFEGPEKLLELWFFDSENCIPSNINQEGLRMIPLDSWVKILDLVNCKVLSMKSSDAMDAYLLSESSLFVFKHKMILKTCGTTTTLACLENLFKIVSDTLFNGSHSSKDVCRIFYSRRSFMFPLKQKHVHRDWKHEVALLNDYFVNGKSYVVGDFSSDDHWYLYMGGSSAAMSQSKGAFTDQTFEILMTELDSNKAKNFVTNRKPGPESLGNEEYDESSDLGHSLGMQTMFKTKLDKVLLGAKLDESKKDEPHVDDLPSPSDSDSDQECELELKQHGLSKQSFIHDAFSFTPCGYSSNSITKSGIYYTLHITPESGWSYASFETNYPFNSNGALSINEVLLRVLKIFEPGKFSATLISDDVGSAANFEELSNCSEILLNSFKTFGYQKQERILSDLKGDYKLLYLNFAKCHKP